MQIVLFLGVTILLASTYVTLYPDEKSTSSVVKVALPHDHIDPLQDSIVGLPPIVNNQPNAGQSHSFSFMLLFIHKRENGSTFTGGAGVTKVDLFCLV